MDTKEIRGDALGQRIRAEVGAASASLRKQGTAPRLAAVVTNSSPAIMSYVESKARAASDLGVIFDLILLPAGSGQEKLEGTLRTLAADPSVHGIMLELPLGAGFDLNGALGCIPQHKDVDGLTPSNLGLLYMGRETEALVPATPQACILLAESVCPLEGIRAGVIGKGRTVGTPLIAMLLNRHATVTVCHSRTEDLAAALRDCKIIFTATGSPGVLNRDTIHAGQVLVDAGIAVLGGKVRGDVDMEAARGVAAAVTLVPQGVGPVTTALIFKNLMRAIELQQT